jgi:cyclophilin family peptidyl-prolyl cis-trans isomerase
VTQRHRQWRAATGLALSIAIASLGGAISAAAQGATAKGDDPLQSIQSFIEKQNVDKSSPRWRMSLTKPPQASFDAKKKYFWKLDTNVGTLKVELLPGIAPMHATSTIYLTLLGFYDGLGFHRVIKGFMAQGGDPAGNGTGGPGYKYAGEFSKDPRARHTRRGVLSMANAGPGTDGSQFFITFSATPHLDDKHTIFGDVVDGNDTLDALEAAGSSSGRPAKTLTIEKAEVVVE